jgi:NAD(P)-dependent dehydrogenase (short-subunit alcohol dehydrogenase family)
MGRDRASSVSAIGTVTDVGPRSGSASWRSTLVGMAACCKYASPITTRGRGGSIINMSSANALVARLGWALYDASKAAMLALTRDMACDLAAQPIRVNAVWPGFG